MAKFFLRTQKKEGSATLYITIQKRTPKVSLRFVATGIVVDVQTWNKANKNVQAWSRYISTNEGMEVNKKMQIVVQTIDQLFAEGRIGGNEDKAVIEDTLREISNAQAIQMEQEVRRIKKTQGDQDMHRVVSFYEYFMKGIVDGSIRHGNGKEYTQGSVEVWKSFGKYLNDYCDVDTRFDDISKPFADKFIVYLEKKGLMLATINKQVGRFRKLCNLAAEEGINSNAVSLKVWKERAVKSSDKRTEVYMTDEELNALYDMKLDDDLSKVRDVFIIGYLSGQRFSDYSDFSIDNFRKVEGGMDVLVLTQKKTGVYVEVPIWDDRLIEVAKKYNYHFPKIGSRRFNREIKVILMELSDSVSSLREKFPTVLQLSERRSEELYKTLCAKVSAGMRLNMSERENYNKLKRYAESHNGSPLFERDRNGRVVRPKWELVSSHTARRSSITNLYKSGLLDNREIMSISGHQSERVFENYIKVGASEQAQRVGKKLLKVKEASIRKAE